MVKRDELVKLIEDTVGQELLTKARHVDVSANGVQVHGKSDIRKLALGVSCNLNFLHEAVSAGADLTLTHHGLNLSPKYVIGARLDPAAQGRLQFVFENNLTVAAFHYALDAQPEFGNSATIIRELGAKRTGETYFDEWGYVGEFDKPRRAEELAKQCAELFSHDIYAVYSGREMVRRIGVATGGARLAGQELFEALDKKVDVHITGEIAEGHDHLVKECGITYFAGGHYATEVFGVQELGKRIKAHYKDKLEVEFIDVPNPL